MNETFCWYCEKTFAYGGEKYRDVNCPYCGVQNSIYNPAEIEEIEEDNSADYPQETEKEEEMAIINDVKLPFLDYNTVKEGEVAVIEGEFVRGGKFNKLSAPVQLSDGRRVQLTINETTAGILVSHWGNDSKAWIGKKMSLSIEKVGSKESVRIWRPVKEK